MISSEIRTDLALEAHESIRNTDSCKSLHGVTVSEYDRKKSHTHITEVNVTTRNGAKAIGKPMGTYITIEAPRMVQNDEGCHREISAELARQLKKLIPGLQKEQSVLVIGLGNRDVTADALGLRLLTTSASPDILSGNMAKPLIIKKKCMRSAHLRPALWQRMEWKPPRSSGES